MEFEDPEFFQMTMNKLKKELDDVKKECRYWRDAAKNQVYSLFSSLVCIIQIFPLLHDPFMIFSSYFGH